jgi:hypothetical protein
MYVGQTQARAYLFMQTTNALGKTTVPLEHDRPRVPGNLYQHHRLRYPLSCEHGTRKRAKSY